ncbi:hypothetical protein GBQ70_14715 [Halomicrobium sp. ZPS1]|uniref:DUF7322 domain-containing protein n=1 Tax=Halomicrobium mukohataei TaxID=57705 RepID=A0A4D6KNN9_9EURY|nr:hypothetical protein E5139_14700 [Halomicrobium mukohataei]QFR21940.1 hypothetical protein GBQ70_14715 [Halomicrobium sp. ZPS1]
MLDPFSLLTEDDASPDVTAATVGEVSRGTFWAFVAALVLSQFGLAAVSLGALYGVVLGQWSLAGALVAVGVAALAGVGVLYWWHRTGRSE